MNKPGPDGDPPLNSDPTVVEFIEDIRLSIITIAAALLRSGQLTETQLHLEAQEAIENHPSPRARQEMVFPTLHCLRQMALSPPSLGKQQQQPD